MFTNLFLHCIQDGMGYGYYHRRLKTDTQPAKLIIIVLIIARLILDLADLCDYL